MLLKRKNILVIIFFILSVSSLYSQEKIPEGSEPVYNLGEVIVTDEYKLRGQSTILFPLKIHKNFIV
jgi:hypothetical protein